MSFPHSCFAAHSFAFGRAEAEVLNQQFLLVDLEITEGLPISSIIYKYFFFHCYAHNIKKMRK